MEFFLIFVCSVLLLALYCYHAQQRNIGEEGVPILGPIFDILLDAEKSSVVLNSKIGEESFENSNNKVDTPLIQQLNSEVKVQAQEVEDNNLSPTKRKVRRLLFKNDLKHPKIYS